eukprot:SAG22_NODE_554_length_9135_cov_3.635569_8_plen_279_part_00
MGGIFRVQDIVQALGGGQGGLLAMWLTMPVEIVQKKQATAKAGETLSVGQCIRTTMAEEGVLGFWRGIGILSVQGFVEKAAYFFPYSVIVYLWEKRVGRMGPFTNLFLGYAAELLRIPFTYPLEVVATYTQTNTDVKSLGETINRVYTGKDGRGGGIGAFWRGISAYYLVAARPAISIAVFDQVKRLYLLRKGLPISSLISFKEAFLFGALGRLVATLICYPCFKMKVLAQSGKGSVMQVGAVVMGPCVQPAGRRSCRLPGCSAQRVLLVRFRGGRPD